MNTLRDLHIPASSAAQSPGSGAPQSLGANAPHSLDVSARQSLGDNAPQSRGASAVRGYSTSHPTLSRGSALFLQGPGPALQVPDPIPQGGWGGAELSPFRPRAHSVPTIVESQVAAELRGISDSFNSLYEPGSDVDEQLPARMDRRVSLPIMTRRRRGSLFLSILQRYLPPARHAPPELQMDDLELNPSHFTPGGSRMRGDASFQISVEEEDEVENAADLTARSAQRGRSNREQRSSVGSVPEDEEPPPGS